MGEAEPENARGEEIVMLLGLILLGGGMCTLLSGVLFYLSSRHQCIFGQRPNCQVCLSGALGMVLLAIFTLTAARCTLTACFMVVLLLMVVCCFFPLFMATIQASKKR